MDLGAFAMEMFQAPCQGKIIILLLFSSKLTTLAHLETDVRLFYGKEQLIIMSKEASLFL